MLYFVIGFIIATLGSRYVYSQEKSHESGIKEVKEYFFFFFFIWPVFGVCLLIDYVNEYKVLERFITTFIIKDKKND